MSKALPEILDIWQDSFGTRCVVLDVEKRWFRYVVKIMTQSPSKTVYSIRYIPLKQFMDIAGYVSSKKLDYLFREEVQDVQNK